MSAYYVIRYLPEVHLKDRKHRATLGRFPTWADADAARMRWVHPQDLRVEGPRWTDEEAAS